MANIAAIFHWPLSELRELTLDELVAWNGRAIERWEAMWAPKKGGK